MKKILHCSVRREIEGREREKRGREGGREVGREGIS